MSRNEMGGDYQYYRIEKRLDELQDLMGEILRRLGKMDYRGEVKLSDGMSPFGGKTMSVDISLEKKNRWDRLSDTNKLESNPNHSLKKKKKKVFIKTDIHGNKI